MPSSVLAKLAVYLDANTAAFASKLEGAQGSLKRFEAAVKSSGAAFAASFGSYEIFNALKSGVQIISEFEAQMSEVKAITGAVGDEFNALRDNALQLGAATKFTSTEVGKLQTEFARLGFSTQEILDATRATIALATATGEDLTKSTIVVGSAIRQFNLPATEANHIADVMTGAFNRTALALDDFGEAMKYVGPAAAAANLNFEQTSALLGILADSGVKGSQAGTSLRRILTDLAKDGRPLSERLRELASRGISLQNSFDDIGRVASTSLLILEKGVDRIDPLSQSFANLHGEAQRVASIMQDNLQGDIVKLEAAFHNLVLAGSSVVDVLRPIAQETTAIFSALTSDNISKLAKFSAILASIGSGSVAPLSAIGAANKIIDDKQIALDNQARAVFVTYAKGFTDVSEAAKKFQDEQYKLLLAAQILDAQNRRLFANDENELAAVNASTQAEIAGRERLIRIASEYIRQTGEQNKQVLQPVINNYDTISKQIATLVEQQKQSQDHTVWQQYADQISHLKLLLQDIEFGKLGARPEGGTAPFADLVKISQLPAPQFLDPDRIDDARAGLKKMAADARKLAEDMTTVTTRFAGVNRQLIELKENGKAAVDIIIHWGAVLSSFTTNAVVAFADALGKAIGGAGQDFGKTFLQGIISFLHQFGELLIAAGVAKLAFDKLLTGGPAGAIGAIAAGATLVALTSAINTSLNRQSQASSQAVANAGRVGAAAVNVNVQGQIVGKGQDMYVILQNYVNNKNG